MTTLRQMAVAFELPTQEVLERLELEAAHHDVDTQLTTRVEVAYALVLDGGRAAGHCWCGRPARRWVAARGDVPMHGCPECSIEHCELVGYMRASGLLP